MFSSFGVFLAQYFKISNVPGGNVLSELFIPKDASIDEYEICQEACVITEHMSSIIEKNGGSALIIDYGKDGPSGFSLRVCFHLTLLVNYQTC